MTYLEALLQLYSKGQGMQVMPCSTMQENNALCIINININTSARAEGLCFSAALVGLLERDHPHLKVLHGLRRG